MADSPYVQKFANTPSTQDASRSAGRSSSYTAKSFYTSYKNFAAPYNPAVLRNAELASARQLFNDLVNKWEVETRWQSSKSAITAHSSFESIKNMGDDGLRFVFERMKSGDIKPHWFPLLYDLAGIDPVPYDKKGFIPEMTAIWLDWGRKAGKF